MFENLGTAIVQAIGFFGVFAFFIYRLLSDKNYNNSSKDKSKINRTKSVKTVEIEKKGLFGRKKKVEQEVLVEKKEKKLGWFNRK
tara:strand:+ start:698 stop:952 length:255 start_codon:yes stop_codon:yes gene_type:complete